MQTDRDRILKAIEENREAIKRFGVRRLGLFGSAARGEASAASDLDFVVEFDRKTFKNYMDFKFFLEDLFHCRVDLVTAESIKPALRETILGEAVHAPGL